MAWTRLDDHFYNNPKIVGISNSAFRLYVAALNWSVSHLTDGKVRPEGPAILLPHDSPRARTSAVRELTSAGLWAENGTGWYVHDFSDYQETKAAIQERREKWTAKKQSQRSSPGDKGETKRGTAPPGPSRERVSPHSQSLKESPIGDSQRAIFGALQAKFGPVSPNHRKRRGLVASGLEALGATGDEIIRRADVWEEFWGKKLNISDTALEKWWGDIGVFLDSRSNGTPDCELCNNRRIIGILEDGSATSLDDLAAKTTARCRCVKGAK